MRRLLNLLLVFFVFILASFHAAAQDSQKPLTNSDVVKLAKAGLADSVIILSIEHSPTAFDTSPQALIDLKAAGVSQPVLEVMLKAGASRPATPTRDAGGSGTPVSTASSGVSGKWKIDESHSPLDDSNTVILTLDAEDKISGPVTARLPTLIIRCKERKTELYIWTGMSASVEYGSDHHTVRYRLDSNPLVKEEWGESGSNDALFSRNGRPLAEQLLFASKIVFEFTPFDHPPVVADFDVRGLGSILPRVAIACAWAGSATPSLSSSTTGDTLTIAAGPTNGEGKSLLEKVIAGLGGEQAVAKVTATRSKSVLHSKTPYGEVTQDVDVITAYPDRRYMAVKGGGVSITRVLNASGVAATMNGKPVPLPATVHDGLLAEIRSNLIFAAQRMMGNTASSAMGLNPSGVLQPRSLM